MVSCQGLVVHESSATRLLERAREAKLINSYSAGPDDSRTRLSEQFVESFREVQDCYRELLHDVRNDGTSMEEFTCRADEVFRQLVELKRRRLRLTRKRDLVPGDQVQIILSSKPFLTQPWPASLWLNVEL